MVEAILPERAVDHPVAIRMDLHMLLLLGARERTEAEFAALLDQAGFDLVRTAPDRLARRPGRDRGRQSQRPSRMSSRSFSSSTSRQAWMRRGVIRNQR